MILRVLGAIGVVAFVGFVIGGLGTMAYSHYVCHGLTMRSGFYECITRFEVPLWSLYGIACIALVLFMAALALHLSRQHSP